MVILFLSELKIYLTVDTLTHMAVADFHEYDTVNVRLHVTFPYISCEDIEVISDNVNNGRGKDTLETVERRASKRKEKGPFDGPGPGCTLDGVITVARTGGSIRLHVMHHDPTRLVLGKNGPTTIGHEMRRGKFAKQGANVSHVVHELGFGPEQAGRGWLQGWGQGQEQDPLRGTVQVSELGPGQMIYNLKVVPTSLQPLHGHEVDTYTYSVGFASLSEAAALSQEASLQWLGVLIAYDFSPVMVKYTETRRSLLEFLTSVCAIIGGVFTVSGMLVQILQGVSRKKMD
ncbi:unnamed protein product [Choristocarpus tenellus]